MARAKTDLVTRVVTLPVRGVEGAAAPLVLDALRPLWARSTALANWAQLELACRDVRRTAGMTTLPRYDRAAVFGTPPRRFNRVRRETVRADGTVRVSGGGVGEPVEGSLYRLFCEEYPDRHLFDGSAVSARDVLAAVEHTWVHHKTIGRYAVLWLGRATAATFRFPYPWPVPSDKGRTLRLGRDADGRPVASIPFPGAADDRATLRLADGREYRRELRAFDFLRDHPDRLAQGKICGHRRGGRLVGALLRLVGRFDPGSAVGDKAATCRTAPDALVRAATDDHTDDPFVYHGDELPGVVAAHDDWSHRFAVDMKHEKRWPADTRRRRFAGPRVLARRERCAARLRTVRQTAAAQLVAWLVRRGVTRLAYNDADKTFLPRFDWTGLREVVRFKCVEAGIRFELVAEAEDDSE